MRYYVVFTSPIAGPRMLHYDRQGLESKLEAGHYDEATFWNIPCLPEIACWEDGAVIIEGNIVVPKKAFKWVLP